MIHTLTSVFGPHIYVINLARNEARWRDSRLEAPRLGIEPSALHRFSAYDFRDWSTLPAFARHSMQNAMCGCSHSHAAIYAHLSATLRPDATALILEDDFEALPGDFPSQFDAAWREVPDNWDLVYLGAGYGSPPTERMSRHVVRAGHIKTTSSYAIRVSHARRMFPLMASCDGPDDTLSGMNPYCNAYVLHPRLLGQRLCSSDIFGHVTHNTQSMSDPHHSAMVDALPFTNPSTP